MTMLDLNKLTIEQVKELNQFSDQLKPEFNKLTEDILNSNGSTLVWMLHPLTSRNPYQSNLFLQLCLLTLAKYYIDNGHLKSDILVQNKLQKIILTKYAAIKTVPLHIKIGKKHWTVDDRFAGYYSVLERAVLYLASRNQNRAQSIADRIPITLIDTFILQNSLKAGKYLDRYYPGLLDQISNSEAKNIYWLPTILGRFNRIQLQQIWQRSREKIIFKQDLLHVSDYFESFLMLQKSGFNRHHVYRFQDMDVTKLVHSEFKKGRVSKSAFEGLLNYFFAKRLSQKTKNLRLVIDWNENQPIDKGFVKGLKEFFPGVASKGYQGYIISTNYNFYIQPTEFEVEMGAIPDEICVVGEALKSQISKFTNLVRVSTAPAFRFKSVYDPLDRTGVQKGTVLVALPIGFKESAEILALVSNAVDIASTHMAILIKPHPMLKLGKVIRHLGSAWKNEFVLVEGEFSEAVSRVEVLLGSTSSTLVEAVSRGIPVIVVGSQSGLTQNPIPETISNKLWSICYTAEELNSAIETYLQASDKEKNVINDIGNRIREQYFERITERGVRQFLKLN